MLCCYHLTEVGRSRLMKCLADVTLMSWGITDKTNKEDKSRHHRTWSSWACSAYSYIRMYSTKTHADRESESMGREASCVIIYIAIKKLSPKLNIFPSYILISRSGTYGECAGCLRSNGFPCYNCYRRHSGALDCQNEVSI